MSRGFAHDIAPDSEHDGDTAMKRTVITGGTRGIGAATALRLVRGSSASLPHEVTVLGSKPCGAAAATGTRSDHAEATDPEAVLAAFERANADGRGLTGLVVSAGIWDPSPLQGDIEGISAQHRRVFEVNVLGAVHAAAAFLMHVRPETSASIVLVGSTAGQRGESGYGAYAASKAALMGLAKSWAVELAPRGVRVNIVAPGWVDTEMTASELGNRERRAEIERAIPRGCVASADDIAGPIAFLLSDDSVHVTGTILSVNGGSVLASY